MRYPATGVLSLRALLNGIRRLEDLSSLVRAAGHVPALQWLSPEGWSEPCTATRAAVLGRHGSFEWLGFETDSSPMALAARVSRRLERSGRLTGVMALAPDARLLALSVSFPPRPILLVELDTPSGLAVSCLERLAGAGQDGALTAAAHLARALDGEAAGRRFFQAFRRTLDRMAGALPARMPAADRHAVGMLQLTRVLFLYFVQAKGWLDGRPAFLREELDSTLATGRSVHRDLLRPLFFGTLNQPAARRGALARRFGAIPFLNGGLFQPHPLERAWRVDLPGPLWRDAFDELFERFHFSLGEGDGTGVAPDMLGRVFEGVMDPAERSDSGTFYTPARLVSAIVRATVAAHLAGQLRISEAEADRRLEAPDPATRSVLDRLTVLDPAAGSGAFLLGALHLLSAARRESPVRARRAVLGRNLFGVDVNATAVRLTELRLWLAVIEDDDAEDPAEVVRLPNLDSFVRQGDSLMEPLASGWGGRVPDGSGRTLAALRGRLLVATGREKTPALAALRRAEADVATAMLGAAETMVRDRIADLVAQGRSGTLFGGQAGLDRRQRAALEALRSRRRSLWSLRRRLDRDGALPWFHFESQFADVFAARGGFDLVVGNPPWVRAEQLPSTLRRYLAARYRWWATTGNGRGYVHQPDLSIAFLERGFELLAPGGTLGLLLPAKLSATGYAAAARAGLASRATLHSVADLTADPRATFDATAYPLALIATRSEPAPGHLVRTRLDATAAPVTPQARLTGAPWILVSSQLGDLLDRLGQYPRLESRLHCHLGVKTGLNDVFLDPPEPIEPELLYWAIRGRDVRAFSTVPTVRLLWTHAASGDPLPRLPPRATAYLASHRQRLRDRKDYSSGPEWTLFRTGAAVAPHRIVWADLAPRLEAAALSGPQAERLIPLNTCYVTPVANGAVALRLTAWLNCTWLRAAAALTADSASGGFRRFNARVVGGLPLPPTVVDDDTLAALANTARAGRLLQRDLDDACARHLDLRPEDRDALAAVAPIRGRDRR